MNKTIYSYLSNDQIFPSYIKKEGEKVSVTKSKNSILIKGGANVADKHYQTKKYIETQVTAEDFKMLESSDVFCRMVERGFLTFKKPVGTKKDKCAPITEKDVKNKNSKAKVEINIKTDEL